LKFLIVFHLKGFKGGDDLNLFSRQWLLFKP